MGRANRTLDFSAVEPVQARTGGGAPFNAFVMANRDRDDVAGARQVMLDFDSTVFPLLDAMATRPGCHALKSERPGTWAGLADLCEGGVPRMLEVFDEVMRYDHMRQHPPLAGAPDALRAIAAHGVAIHVMTQRKPEFADGTARYLADHGIPYDSIVCDLDHNKLDLCRERGIDIIIDDHPDLLGEAHQAGLTAMSYSWPYNAAVADEHDLNHSTDWNELGQHALDAVESRIKTLLTTRLINSAQ